MLWKMSSADFSIYYHDDTTFQSQTAAALLEIVLPRRLSLRLNFKLLLILVHPFL